MWLYSSQCWLKQQKLWKVGSLLTQSRRAMRKERGLSQVSDITWGWVTEEREGMVAVIFPTSSVRVCSSPVVGGRLQSYQGVWQAPRPTSHTQLRASQCAHIRFSCLLNGLSFSRELPLNLQAYEEPHSFLRSYFGDRQTEFCCCHVSLIFRKRTCSSQSFQFESWTKSCSGHTINGVWSHEVRRLCVIRHNIFHDQVSLLWYGNNGILYNHLEMHLNSNELRLSQTYRSWNRSYLWNRLTEWERRCLELSFLDLLLQWLCQIYDWNTRIVL